MKGNGMEWNKELSSGGNFLWGSFLLGVGGGEKIFLKFYWGFEFF